MALRPLTGPAAGRRRAVGAEPVQSGVHFRVWAPDHQRVMLVIEGPRREEVEMEREATGHHSLLVPALSAGALYRFRTGDEPDLLPDPASRRQPQGPHGPSEVVDPSGYRWRHDAPPLDRDRLVIYEMHTGTFTREGTWRSAVPELAPLADLGITTIEMMPVNEFPGSFGWGYDGVDLWAPTRNYGSPDDLREFVDRAHGAGLTVILDVVYNHFGPDGCYLAHFAKSYFTRRYENEWGEAVNFEGEEARGSREFFVENAAHWIDEYRFDGLRIDATQSIFDSSERHVLADIASSARAAAAGREILLVAENEPQDVRLLRPVSEGGFGLDGVWNDDFHHAAAVALTGRREAYYTDYTGTPQELISAAKYGFLYQGQRYQWQKKRRGTPSRGIAPRRFVWFLENHDQVANSARGRRMHQSTSPSRYRAMTALLLLGPATPMLFQGQEYGAREPFYYFADHQEELARRVAGGRRDFLAQFPSAAVPAIAEALPDPAARGTFESCRLRRDGGEESKWSTALHRDLLRLRREMRPDTPYDGAVLGERAFVMRWFDETNGDFLLIVNLGTEIRLQPAPEPLLAPEEGSRWRILWSSEWPRYGGSGTAEPETDEGWVLAAETAVLLRCEEERWPVDREPS